VKVEINQGAGDWCRCKGTATFVRLVQEKEESAEVKEKAKLGLATGRGTVRT